MAKKLVFTEVQKINILGKGLLKQATYGSRDKRGPSKKRPRFNRKKDDE